ELAGDREQQRSIELVAEACSATIEIREPTLAREHRDAADRPCEAHLTGLARPERAQGLAAKRAAARANGARRTQRRVERRATGRGERLRRVPRAGERESACDRSARRRRRGSGEGRRLFVRASERERGGAE